MVIGIKMTKNQNFYQRIFSNFQSRFYNSKEKIQFVGFS